MMSTAAQLDILANRVGEWIIREVAFLRAPGIHVIDRVARERFFSQFSSPQVFVQWLDSHLNTFSGGAVRAILQGQGTDGVYFIVSDQANSQDFQFNPISCLIEKRAL